MLRIFSPDDAGFGLVDLVVVVLTLAILAAVVVPVVGDKMDGARVSAAREAMTEIGNAFEQYHIDTASWPSNTPADSGISTANSACCGYGCLYANIGERANWRGPYLGDAMVDPEATHFAVGGKAIGVLDPWGFPYRVYTFAEGYDGGAGAILLFCSGSNGRIDSFVADVYADTPAGDDFTWTVTRKLSIGPHD
jgi:type II secretory pathway pseudopilin PulG